MREPQIFSIDNAPSLSGRARSYFGTSMGRREQLDKFLRYLRCCALCGKSWGPIDLFCESCLPIFWSQCNRGESLKQAGYPFPVYSLFTWTKENDRVLRAFIYAFKQGWAVAIAKELALRMTSEISSRGEAPLIPSLLVPASSTGRFDHAQLFAEALAQAWPGGHPRVHTLTSAPDPFFEGTPQKARTVADRSRIRFIGLSGRENLSYPAEISDQPWLFIDDVITTGSTAMAAYIALGEVFRFSVWTLTCRPKLAN